MMMMMMTMLYTHSDNNFYSTCCCYTYIVQLFYRFHFYIIIITFFLLEFFVSSQQRNSNKMLLFGTHVTKKKVTNRTLSRKTQEQPVSVLVTTRKIGSNKNDISYRLFPYMYPRKYLNMLLQERC